MKKAVRAAIKLFRSFREKDPQRLGVVDFDVPEAVMVIGHVESIKYRTTRAGKTELYEHPFQAGSRPLLAASSDGRQLMLLGGRYQFGSRGIVDRDSRGKLVYEPEHGEEMGFMRKRQAD